MALMRAVDPKFEVELIVDGRSAAERVAGVELLLVGIGDEDTGEFALIRKLGELAAPPKVILVADALEPDLVRFVLDERCNGLILTDTTPEDFAACLAQIAHGQAVLPADWQAALSGGRDDPVDTLSHRQLEVLTLLAGGSSHDEIGAQLFISLNTVKFHIRSIYERLGVNNALAAARLLAEHQNRRGHASDSISSDRPPG